MKLLTLVFANKTVIVDGLGSLIKQYGYVFAVTDQELTQTEIVECTVDAGDAAPIKQKARLILLALEWSSVRFERSSR